MSCSSSPDKIIVGTWIHNDVLHNREVANFHQPMGDLSQVYGKMKFIFNEDFTYKIYLTKPHNKVNDGKWEIKNGLLHMTDIDNDKEWHSFFYKLNKNELFIYDREWLMTLAKK